MGRLIFLIIVCFIFGGWDAVKAMFETIWLFIQTVVLPFFPMILENIVTDPYVIARIIMLVASGCGIWFGVKGGKALYAIISIICAIISLASMFV